MDRIQPKLIRAQTCVSCVAKHTLPGGQIECRFNPPSVTPIIGGSAQGGPQIVGHVTSFPFVQADQWCKQYRRSAIDDRLTGLAIEDLRAS